MDSPTLLCIDDRPQMLKLRKITLESQGYLRQARVQRLHRDKDVRGNVGRGGSAGVQIGRHRRGSHSMPYEAKASQPADHSALRLLRDARANPVVGG
jgi:hypothetical protein